MKLKRKKIGDRQYNLVDEAGRVIATAAQTGEHGRDNYPWEWHLLDDRIFGMLGLSTGKSEDSLKNCVDFVEANGTAYGLYKPVGPLDPYEVKEGQVFRYSYYYYRAISDAHGEFNAYIPVNDHRGENTEIVVAHGNTVTLYELETN